MGDISQRGLDFIKRKEGYFGKAYQCSAGVWTLGWGTIRWDAGRPVKKGDTCTQEQAEKLLLKEVQRVEDAVDATIRVPLSQGQYDCIVSFGYNLGIGWITGKGHQQATLIRLLNKGQYDKVPSELLKFSKVKDPKTRQMVTVRGLLIRRQEEIRELWLADYDSNAAIAKTPAPIVETDPETEPMPQAVVPGVPSVPTIAKGSPTVQMSALGILATTFGQAWEWLFGVAKEAGPEVVTNQTALSPFNALLTTVGANMGLLAAIIAVGTLIIVIQRKVASERA
jgi:lysozyme